MSVDTVVPEHDGPAPAADTFRFGRNWQRYVTNHLDGDRERIAADSLRDLVGDLKGKSFVDIGCGSGLFSLCAHRAGAASIISMDVDPDAVAATRHLHAAAGAPETWRILHRSILDDEVVKELGFPDVVYSWGVLHHTGDMYKAIANAAAVVPAGGTFAIAIYNRRSDGWLNSGRWWRIKRAYNHTPRPIQAGMELAYAAYWLLSCLRNRQNPVREAREYRRSRGMALWTDLVDWLGGYPYEYATAQEIVDYCGNSCELRCERVIRTPANGTGNNQFVFERAAAR